MQRRKRSESSAVESTTTAATTKSNEKTAAQPAAVEEKISDGVPETEGAPAAGPEANEPKRLARPYRPVFTSTAAGFELGENYRFRQRVFLFSEAPAEEIKNKLKDSGFRYRPAEKAWTIEANAVNREMSDRLAQEFIEMKLGTSRSR